MKKMLILLSIVVLAVTSCATEEYVKSARNFYDNNDSLAVLVLRPDKILYTNHKVYDSLLLDTLSQAQISDFLIDNSIFLKNLDDTIINEVFVDKFIRVLAQTNLKVYTSDFFDEFEKNNSDNQYVIDLRKLEFDEYIDVVTDEYMTVKHNLMGGKDTVLFVHDTYLNYFAGNIWLDYHSPYSDTTSVLYANNRISDSHYGMFTKDYYGDVVYYEDNLELTPGNIITFLDLIAGHYANYVYNHILNDYMRANEKEVMNFSDSLSVYFELSNGKIKLVDQQSRFINMR